MKTLTLIILSIALLLAKIFGLIHISILWCLSPLWLPVALFLALALVIFPLVAIALMTIYCLFFLFAIPAAIIHIVVRDALHRHKHDWQSKPLGLDQCADRDCGSIRETR